MRRAALTLAALALLAVAWHLGRASRETGPGPADEAVSSATASTSATPDRRLLDRAAAEARVAEKPGDALTLLALARATGDPSWRERALAEHPDDPRVQLERWRGATTPEVKLAAARALQAAAPDNPLGSYLEATLAFDRGDLGAVARLLTDAGATGAYDAYMRDVLVETQSAFRAAGMDAYQAWEAAWSAEGALNVGLLIDLRRLGDDMGELQHVFVEMGHWDEADFLFERTLALGEQLEDSGTLIESLFGIDLQQKLLGSYDAETLVSDDGTRARQRLAELEAAKATIQDVAAGSEPAGRALDASGWERYLEIFRQDGELAALRWLKERPSTEGR